MISVIYWLKRVSVVKIRMTLKYINGLISLNLIDLTKTYSYIKRQASQAYHMKEVRQRGRITVSRNSPYTIRI